MLQVYRILKTGGWAILQVPISLTLKSTHEDSSIVDPDQRYIHFGQHNHVRLYGADYKNRLEKVGFRVEVISPSMLFSLKLIRRYALIENENLYIAHKPRLQQTTSAGDGLAPSLSDQLR